MNTNKYITPYGRLDGSEGGFARIANALLQSPAYKDLNGTARSLLQCFYNKWMKQRMAKLKLGIQLGPLDPAIPFARGMAKDAGISEGSYKRDIGTLQSMGFLKMTQTGGGRKHSHFKPIEAWRTWEPDTTDQDKTAPQRTEKDRMIAIPHTTETSPNIQGGPIAGGIKAIRQGDQDGPGRGDQVDPGLDAIVSLSSGVISSPIPSCSTSGDSRVETGSLTQEIFEILECAPESLTLVNLAGFDNRLEETGIPHHRLSEAAMLAREYYAESPPTHRFDKFTGIVAHMNKKRLKSPTAGLLSTEIEGLGKSERQARLVSIAKDIAQKRLSWNGQIQFLHRLEDAEGHLQEDDLIIALANALDELQNKYPKQESKEHMGARASVERIGAGRS